MCGIGGILTTNPELSFFLMKEGLNYLSRRGEDAHGATAINPAEVGSRVGIETKREQSKIGFFVPEATYHSKSSNQKLNDMQKERKAPWFLMQTKYTTSHHTELKPGESEEEAARKERRLLLENTQPIRLIQNLQDIALVSNGNYNSGKLQPLMDDITTLLSVESSSRYMGLKKAAQQSDSNTEYSFKAVIDTFILAEHLLLNLASGASVEQAIQNQLRYQGAQASILYESISNSIYAYKSTDGIRPLSIASLQSPQGDGIIIGSETGLFEELHARVEGRGVTELRHVKPGEVLRFSSEDINAMVSNRVAVPVAKGLAINEKVAVKNDGVGCEFEDIYFKDTYSRTGKWDVSVDRLRHEETREYHEFYKNLLKDITAIVPMQHSGDSYGQGMGKLLDVEVFDALRALISQLILYCLFN